MPEHENNTRDEMQESQLQSQHPAEADASGSLKASILAHLGLPFQAQEPVPAWQKNVEAVQKLAEICNRTNVRQVVEALEKDLGQKEKAVRMAVVRALGMVYLDFPGHVRWELFMNCLADPSPEVRATTIQTFMTFVVSPYPRPPHAQAIERLVKKLAQMNNGQAVEDELVRINIIQLMSLLENLAPDPAIATIVFIACNHKEDWSVREAAMLALSSLYPRLSPEQVLQVGEVLYDKHPFVRRAAMSALRGQLPIAVVLEVLRTGDKHKQVYAAQALGQWGKRLTLRDLALDQKAASSARAAAIRGLAQLARGQDLILKSTELDSLVNERDFSVKAAAEELKNVLRARNPHASREEGIG